MWQSAAAPGEGEGDPVPVLCWGKKGEREEIWVKIRLWVIAAGWSEGVRSARSQWSFPQGTVSVGQREIHGQKVPFRKKNFFNGKRK